MRLQPRQAADLVGLKALVGVMGVLIVLGTALVIGVVVHRIYAPPAVPSMPVVGASAAGTAPFVLRQGTHVAGIAGAGGMVAVWTTGPAGDQVLLVDPRTGAASPVVTAAGAADPSLK